VIPLRDENPPTVTPLVTYGLIAVNVVVFLYEALLGPDLKPFMMAWGFVPRTLSEALVTGDRPVLDGVIPLVTSMFLHGGWAHLIGNMWYLLIFGDNVEDLLGHGRFLAFYLVCGVFAALIHYATNANSPVTTVGASGAIAGVLGAYLVAYPRTRVITLVPFFPFFQIMALPAVWVLGLWFVYQAFSGVLALGWSPKGTGIAWWAHIGGFAFGWIVMRVVLARRGRGGGTRMRPELA